MPFYLAAWKIVMFESTWSAVHEVRLVIDEDLDLLDREHPGHLPPQPQHYYK
jgi:hypothetical protein